jgi:hypothetical protein
MALDPLLEQTQPHVRSSRRKRPRDPRMPSRLERWAWSEIPAYRVGLFLGYLVLIYIGISAVIAGVPIFDLTAFEGWASIWGSVIIAAGVVGTLGSIHDSPRFRAIELAGAWTASVFLVGYAGPMLAYAYGQNDPNRAAVGAVLTGLTIPPVIRMLWLMAKVLRDRKMAHDAKQAKATQSLVVVI